MKIFVSPEGSQKILTIAEGFPKILEDSALNIKTDGSEHLKIYSDIIIIITDYMLLLHTV